ncbi:MAG: hypothetical protein CMA45_05560 [Euryarchaeota archaeon]|nr:hypothetical protein [Euryarchaeota archaeon]
MSEENQLKFDENITIRQYFSLLFSDLEINSELEEFEHIQRAINKVKRKRDQKNELVKKYVKERNDLNKKTRDAIKLSRDLRELRQIENAEVKKLKQKRTDVVADTKKLKQDLINSNESKELEKQLAALIKKQNDIHELVQNAAKDAQSTHEQAMLLEEKIQKMKVDANQMHKKSKSTKSISDDYHKIFILFIERKNELVDIVNKIQENEL